MVIDHHPVRPDSRLAPIADVGGPIGATSTVVVEYLRASKLEVPPAIATALFYGIKADTRDLGRQTTPQDVEAYLWLFPRTDKDAMGQIEHPPLSLEYFALSRTAIDQAEVHGHAVVLPLGELYAPDMVAEVAERFLYLEGMRWSLAFGTFEGDLYYSVRTTDRRANAGKLIREVIEPRGGSAGGHGSMAGARLPARDLKGAALKKLAAEVVRDFLAAFGETRARRDADRRVAAEAGQAQAGRPPAARGVAALAWPASRRTGRAPPRRWPAASRWPGRSARRWRRRRRRRSPSGPPAPPPGSGASARRARTAPPAARPRGPAAGPRGCGRPPPRPWSREGALVGEQLEEHGPEREEVGARRERRAAQLLRRQVVDLAEGALPRPLARRPG